MDDTVRDFYDDLSDDHHLIFQDWERSVERQARALDALLRAYLGDGSHSVLDCSCGIGTQAIGLARLGHAVTGTDLSPKAVERARVLAADQGVELRLDVVDMRALEERVPGSFEAVISCDNALPHLLTAADLGKALRAIRSKVSDEGIFIASVRDYDALARERPTATPVSVLSGEEGRRAVFQLWDWDEAGLSYRLDQFILRESGGGWDLRHGSTWYRAWRRTELETLLAESGFEPPRWLAPEESGYFQPLLAARPA